MAEKLCCRNDPGGCSCVAIKMLHPMTGLPTGTEIDELLTAHQAQEDWCVMMVSLEGFQAFDGDAHSARSVLRFVAYLLTDVVDELGGPADWVAHRGGDEFVIATQREYANRIRDRLQRRFDEEKLGFYDPLDWSRGFTEVAQPGGGTRRVPVMRINFALLP
jgi:GGDEF domain-containing protein